MFCKEKTLTFGLGLLLLCGTAQQSHARDYYVASGVSSGNGDSTPAAGIDAAGRGAVGSPFLTIQYAVKQVGAGDRVLVRNGAYNERVIVGYDLYNNGFVTTATGTGDADSARIIIRAENLPSGNTYHAFIKAASANDNVSGKREYYAGCFTVASANANTLVARSSNVHFSAAGSTLIGYVTIQGFDMTTGGYDGKGVIGNWAHHVSVLNNYVHDCGEGGVIMMQCDYTKINQNTISGNCHTSAYNGSGVSLLRSVAYDTATGYHNVITQNKVLDNYISASATTVYGGTKLISHTDGNGIIIDTSPFANTKTQIMNNLVTGSGGPGILLDAANGVDIFSNTCYQNNTDSVQNTVGYATNRGEIQVQQTTWAQDVSEYDDAYGTPLFIPNTNPPQPVRTPSNPLNAVSTTVRAWGNLCYPRANYTSDATYSGHTYTYTHAFYGLCVQDTTTNSSFKDNWLYKSGFVNGLAFADPLTGVTNFPDVTTLDSTTAISSNYGGDLTGSNPLLVSSSNLHLQAGSPCIGKSLYSEPNFDLEGFARYTDGKYDMGAYEFH